MDLPRDAREVEIRRSMLDAFTVWLMKRHGLLIDPTLLALAPDLTFPESADAPTRPELLMGLAKLVTQIEDNDDDERPRVKRPDPGCQTCTSNSTPYTHETGLCAYHGALALLDRAVKTATEAYQAANAAEEAAVESLVLAEGVRKRDEAKAELSKVVTQIEAYNVGDRPQSPPATLLMEERRLTGIVALYERACAKRVL